ncbi:MAG: nucleoside triphosphate pyrophosphatase [Gammaproteobacteria bacterium]|jgi:septum formation protein
MIYLASSSPRRAELLRQIGVEFRLHATDIDETWKPGENPEDYVLRIAADKARTALRELGDSAERYPVLAADTTIALDDDIIGKPADLDGCRRILERLSAREHLVLTAVVLATADGLASRLNRSRVRFRPLSATEIETYCSGGEPMDKAGAYAIQGKAAIFVENLEGSYSAVMGLPLFETAELLREAGLAPL